MKRWRGKRYLLNPPGYQTTAAIVAEIEDTRKWRDGCDRDGDPLRSYGFTPEYTLQLSNCDRSISFNIDWATPHERRASLTKVNRMVDALTTFRDALVEEQALYAERAKAYRVKA